MNDAKAEARKRAMDSMTKVEKPDLPPNARAYEAPGGGEMVVEGKVKKLSDGAVLLCCECEIADETERCRVTVYPDSTIDGETTVEEAVEEAFAVAARAMARKRAWEDIGAFEGFPEAELEDVDPTRAQLEAQVRRLEQDCLVLEEKVQSVESRRAELAERAVEREQELVEMIDAMQGQIDALNQRNQKLEGQLAETEATTQEEG